LERFEGLHYAFNKIVRLHSRRAGRFKGRGLFLQLVPDPPDIRFHAIPRFRRLLAEGCDTLFQSGETECNGGQVLLELPDLRGERREVRVGARSDLVAQGLNLLSGPSRLLVRGRAGFLPIPSMGL
jgi:hypothetical protein